MQKLISQIPQLAQYLSKVPKNQHRETIKRLIRIGIQASRSYCCKQNTQNSSNGLRQEIDSIKENIKELNNVLRQQSYSRCCQKQNTGENQRVFQTEPINVENRALREQNNQFCRAQQNYEQKPVRDGVQVGTVNFTKSQPSNPFSKNKGPLMRHHLDDTEAREALTFPPETLAENQVRVKRKSESYRRHIYQDEINKEELEKIKEERGQSVDKLKRDRTVSDYSKATSKIKSLLEKDRLRHTQRQREYQFKEGFNKYEYSDQNQMEEQSSMHEQMAKTYEARLQQPNFAQQNTYDQHFQSSFKASNPVSSHQKSNSKTSSKKQFQRSKNQVSSKLEASLGELKQEYSKQSAGSQKHYKNNKSVQIYQKQQQEGQQDDDVISNSSSFSQFSMEGSRRKQVGKISRRSHND